MASPQVIRDAAAMRAWSRELRRQGKTVGFVPTMGYLHEGHISLVKAAGEQCDVVAASIYVNPTQFSANEDFGVYPRSEAEDLRKLAEAGCAAVFMPAALYHPGSNGSGSAANAAMVVGASDAVDPEAHETWVSVERLSQGLCAKTRPHFFRGVCTVVTKLFHIVEPDAAFFGKKDYQQWRVIQRMVRDLDMAIDVVGMPICREADGLAMSSRNALLTPEDRQRCICISQALAAACEAAVAGTTSAAAELQRQVADAIAAGGGRVDYVEVVDARTLRPVEDVKGCEALIAVAAFYGKVRLIDNVDFTA
ncbi:Pantoate--beta-alanine ligase [Chlorella sorokiniana]|uniref:Pantoate--beta-alanine ligase n=1 Tax=Chlorella sorokiniana TaxID=3076 RepID=A0A2P6U205_CHLSO|nr:Pantoate--beta-alanine ligase [Chlorella sorokiniana]|eukprot:PRW60347.1 Pantoate--beta-alanine ligase [Chlorella sorokiniana]